MKIETIEESAEKWVFETNGHKWSNNDNSAGDNYGSFIAGFKCCQEQTYSEEDMREAIVKSALSNIDNMIERCDEIIEQFKNK